MKARKVLYIIVAILIISFLLYGCKQADTSGLEERIKELEEEAALNQSEDIVEEAPEEELEEIRLEYYPECEVSFDKGNIFEIGQEGLDLGVQEEPSYLPFGYRVLFATPDTIDVEIENFESWEQPLIDERIVILNEEFSSLSHKEVVDYWYSSSIWDASEIEILQYDNIGEEIFIIIWQEPGEKTWWVQYRFTEIGGYTFMHGVSAIDYCYDPWSDLLINTTIEERLVIEDRTVEEHIEEKSEGPQATKPNIGLTVIEGPISEDGICYYRVAANTGGSPSPNITFNRDDSDGDWGSDVAQINLTGPDDTFALIATAANSAGSATDSITLAWGCEMPKEEPKDEPNEEDPVKEE